MSTLPTHPYLRHPHTGEPLRAVGVLKGRPVWPIIGASPDDNAGGGNSTGSQGTGSGNANNGNATGSAGNGTGNTSGQGGNGDTGESGTDRGFPEGTPLERMTVEQREAYWKYHARKHETAAKQAPSADELAQLRDKAKKYDEHEKSQMTELEREQAKTAELQQKVTSYERDELRRKAARDAGLSTDDAEFITGATAAEMKASAERLKTRLGTAGTAGQATSHDQGSRGRNGTQQNKAEAGMAEARKRGFVKTTQS